MIIVVGNWKRKAVRLVLTVVAVAVFVAAVPVLTGKLYHKVPVGGWFKDEHPSGNPMRVEKKVDEDKSKEAVNKTGFDKTLDQFVIKLQDFYSEE